MKRNRGRLAWVAVLLPMLALAQRTQPKPDVPVEKWAGKTILLIGAHADDDSLSHGTLAMLQAHGNEVYVLTLTTGNVGTQDPNLSRTQLALIRRQEELDALAELGIPAGHYIILGMTTDSSNSKITKAWWRIWFA
jgi:LmbE family N-acetylglucosaminyl deacetylase